MIMITPQHGLDDRFTVKLIGFGGFLLGIACAVVGMYHR